MPKRVVRTRGTNSTKKTTNRVQLRQEFVTLENTEMVEPFLDQGRRLLVSLQHKVREVVAARSSPSGCYIDCTFTPGEDHVFLDWESMQSLPNKEAIYIEYYQALPFDGAAVWERAKLIVEDIAFASTTTQNVVVEFLLRKMKSQWPDVFSKVAGEKV